MSDESKPHSSDLARIVRKAFAEDSAIYSASDEENLHCGTCGRAMGGEHRVGCPVPHALEALRGFEEQYQAVLDALREACLHQGLPEDAPPDRIAAHFRGNREFTEAMRNTK